MDGTMLAAIIPSAIAVVGAIAGFVGVLLKRSDNAFAKDCAGFCLEVKEVMADGDVTPDELDRLEVKFQEVFIEAAKKKLPVSTQLLRLEAQIDRLKAKTKKEA